MRISSLLSALLFAVPLFISAQDGPLLPTIRPIGTFLPPDYHGWQDKVSFVDNKFPGVQYSLPADLATSKIFYIDLEGFPTGSPTAKRVNEKFREAMADYPHPYEAFTHDLQQQDKQYFVDLGFKYRVLLYTNFSKITGDQDWAQRPNRSGPTISYEQAFRIVLEDLETGQIYFGPSREFLTVNKFTKAFVKDAKKVKVVP